MRVWILEDAPPYEQGTILGVFAEEALAIRAKQNERYADYLCITEFTVVDE